MSDFGEDAVALVRRLAPVVSTKRSAAIRRLYQSMGSVFPAPRRRCRDLGHHGQAMLMALEQPLMPHEPYFCYEQPCTDGLNQWAVPGTRAKQGIRAFRGPACPLLRVAGSRDLSLARSGTCLLIQPAGDVDEARYQGLSRPGLSLFGGVAAYGTCPCSTLAFFWQLI